MTECNYYSHKTIRIVWNWPKASRVTFPYLTVSNRAPRCHSCTHVPSCLTLKPSQSLRRRMSALSDTLIIGNIDYNLLKLLKSLFWMHSVYSAVWTWVTDILDPPSYKFTFYITREIDDSDVSLLSVFVYRLQNSNKKRLSAIRATLKTRLLLKKWRARQRHRARTWEGESAAS